MSYGDFRRVVKEKPAALPPPNRLVACLKLLVIIAILGGLLWVIVSPFVMQ